MSKTRLRGFLVGVAFAFSSAWSASSLSFAAETAKPQYGDAGFDGAGADFNAKAGDDFFRYANGAWFDATEIPADRANWGTSPELIELTNARVADLIKTATAAPAA